MGSVRVCHTLATGAFRCMPTAEAVQVMLEKYGKHEFFEHLRGGELLKPYFDLDKELDQENYTPDAAGGQLWQLWQLECLLVDNKFSSGIDWHSLGTQMWRWSRAGRWWSGSSRGRRASAGSGCWSPPATGW